jgi:hypothetical protein
MNLRVVDGDVPVTRYRHRVSIWTILSFDGASVRRTAPGDFTSLPPRREDTEVPSKNKPSLRRLPKLDERYRLNPHHVETFPAPHILATHRVIAANHVALRLGKTSPVAVIGPSRQLGFLSPHHPVDLILTLLPTVRTRHHMRPLLRLFIKKVPLFHMHLAGRRPVLLPSPICNPA